MSDDKDIYKEWAVRSEEFWKERCRVALGEEYESLLRVARAAKDVTRWIGNPPPEDVAKLSEALKEVEHLL